MPFTKRDNSQTAYNINLPVLLHGSFRSNATTSLKLKAWGRQADFMFGLRLCKLQVLHWPISLSTAAVIQGQLFTICVHLYYNVYMAACDNQMLILSPPRPDVIVLAVVLELILSFKCTANLILIVYIHSTTCTVYWVIQGWTLFINRVYHSGTGRTVQSEDYSRIIFFKIQKLQNSPYFCSNSDLYCFYKQAIWSALKLWNFPSNC